MPVLRNPQFYFKEDLNTPIVSEKTDTVIDFKEYIKYIFGDFDLVSEYKSNLYKIFGIKNNIGIKADVISKDLLLKNSLVFFKSSNHTCTGATLDKLANLYIYEPVMLNLVGFNNIRFNKDKIKVS